MIISNKFNTPRLVNKSLAPNVWSISFCNKETLVAEYHYSQKSIVLRQRSITIIRKISLETNNPYVAPITFVFLMNPNPTWSSIPKVSQQRFIHPYIQRNYRHIQNKFQADIQKKPDSSSLQYDRDVRTPLSC